MTLDDEQMRELAANERWLRGEEELTGPPNVNALKLRTQIEAHEQWLGDQWTDAMPAGLVDRAKARVHVEIETTKRNVVPSGHHLLRWGAGVALAAAACLAMVIGIRSTESRVSEDIWRLDAFEAYSPEGVDETLAMLGDDLADLEFALLDNATDGFNDGTVDELLDAIQDYDLDEAIDDDWS